VTNRNELVEDTVEVVHEALIRNWGRLQGWIKANLTEANLSNADLKGASLYKANISSTNFKGAKNLTIEQIKSATNWQSAKYDNDVRIRLGLPTK
jgi:uncharacterized protein YjbI with pentapeptide repeats